MSWLSVTEKVLLGFTELIESAMYLYRATGDPTLLELGRDAVESIEKISKVECGFATVSVLQGPGSWKCLLWPFTSCGSELASVRALAQEGSGCKVMNREAC